jgi:hypothetical protein
MPLKLIEHGSMFLHLYIYIFLSLTFIQQENVSFHFTVYPCRACKQTNGKQKKEEEDRERENVYKNEQNGTNTRRQPMRQNREVNDRQKRKTKMSYELRFK